MEKSFYAPQAFREKDGSPNQCFGIEIVPSRRCTLACEACYKLIRQRMSRVGGLHYIGCTTDASMDTPAEDVLDYAAQAKAAGFQEVALLGGEPTMHANIAEIVDGIRQRDLVPILVTNGLNLKPSLVEALSASKAVVVTHASIPGRGETIDDAAGRSGYAAKLQESIGKLRSAPGVRLVLEMPLTASLYAEAFLFFVHCRGNGITPFIEISRRADNGKPTTHVTPEQVATLFEQCRQYDHEHFPELEPAIISPPAYGNPCTMSITGLHVKNLDEGDYGGVYSCCAQKVRHGDLKEQTLGEILRSPTLTVFRDQDRYIVGPCKDCELYPVCKGGCRGEAVLKFGCPRASSPACHHIPPDVRKDRALMAPASCEGCPLEDNEECGTIPQGPVR